MTEINWRTLKLFDLSKAKIRIAMKERSILPALIEVIDGDWVFTISVAVVGEEEARRDRVMGESTRKGSESHPGTGGGRREERDRSTVGSSFYVGEAGRNEKEGERSSTEALPVGTRGKNGQSMGNSWFNSNSKKLIFGPEETTTEGKASASGNEALTVENGRAFVRESQTLSIFSLLTAAKTGCNLKSLLRVAQGTGEKKPDGEQGSLRRGVSAAGTGKGVPADPDVQTRGSAKKKVKEMKFGSKKLWNTLFPPSSVSQHGSLSCSEPILLGKPSSNRKEIPKEEAFGAGAQKEQGASASPIFFCRSTRNRKWGLEKGASSASGEKATRKSFFEEDREGFLGRVGFDPRGPSVTFLPSSLEIRGKGLNFLGNCGLSVAENVEVISSASS